MSSRVFRLSETSRKHSRAATARRILEERRRDMTFRPALLPPRPHSPALGSESTLSGEARIARLAQPRTQLWEKCALSGPCFFNSAIPRMCSWTI